MANCARSRNRSPFNPTHVLEGSKEHAGALAILVRPIDQEHQLVKLESGDQMLVPVCRIFDISTFSRTPVVDYEWKGEIVIIRQLSNCAQEVYDVSATFVQKLTDGGRSQELCKYLRSGQVRSFGSARFYQLRRSEDGWRLQSDVAFYNGCTQFWMDLKSLKRYRFAPYVYVAFSPHIVPQVPLPYLVKCGYKSLSQDSLQEDLCEYFEENKATLKLDRLGSGVVFFPARSSHRHYKVAGLAVEETLKNILLNLDGFTPCDQRGIVKPYISGEWFLGTHTAMSQLLPTMRRFAGSNLALWQPMTLSGPPTQLALRPWPDRLPFPVDSQEAGFGFVLNGDTHMCNTRMF